MSYYEFISEEPKNLIKKIVEFTETGTENVYNLGFADYDEITKTTSDISVTNNGDSLKLLATGASTVYTLLRKTPKRGFLQQEVQILELGYTEWELQIIWPK